jgi:hypothetical protein
MRGPEEAKYAQFSSCLYCRCFHRNGKRGRFGLLPGVSNRGILYGSGPALKRRPAEPTSGRSSHQIGKRADAASEKLRFCRVRPGAGRHGR